MILRRAGGAGGESRETETIGGGRVTCHGCHEARLAAGQPGPGAEVSLGSRPTFPWLRPPPLAPPDVPG